MRPLRDYTKLNSTMALRIPDFWREFCPTIEAIRSMFPSWCKFMAVHDCKNAHHSVKLSDESYKYCNSRYIDANGNPRIIQALGADQGINAIALSFPIWVRFGYNWFLGQAWLEGSWYADFVDDTLVLGRNEAECKLRHLSQPGWSRTISVTTRQHSIASTPSWLAAIRCRSFAVSRVSHHHPIEYY